MENLGAEESKTTNCSEEQLKINTMNQRRRSMARSGNRLVELLRRNTTRNIGNSHVNRREYRVITSGEDGMVYFWNVMADYNGADLS